MSKEHLDPKKAMPLDINLLDMPKERCICNVHGILTCKQMNNIYIKLLKHNEYLNLISIEALLQTIKYDGKFFERIYDVAIRKGDHLKRIAPIIVQYIEEEYEQSAR